MSEFNITESIMNTLEIQESIINKIISEPTTQNQKSTNMRNYKPQRQQSANANKNKQKKTE